MICAIPTARRSESISRYRWSTTDCSAHGEQASAARQLRALHDVLEVHDAVEELALYPAMARLHEYGDKIGTLFDEHDDFDHVVSAALTASESAGAGAADWVAVLVALETLGEHIDHEEHGVFPAAAVSLDPADWERAAAVRARQAPRLGGPGEG